MLRLPFVGKVSIPNGQSNVALAMLSKCGWLRNPSLFLQLIITWVFSFFPRLSAATCFSANCDWFIVIG